MVVSLAFGDHSHANFAPGKIVWDEDNKAVIIQKQVSQLPKTKMYYEIIKPVGEGGVEEAKNDEGTSEALQRLHKFE